MDKVKVDNVSIDLHQKIGISLSGGADSAILAYIILKFYKNPVHFFSLGVEDKNYVTLKHSVEVINKCAELTGRTDIYHNIKYTKKYNRDEFINFLLEQTTTNLVDAVYTATTNIPDHSTLSKFSNKLESGINGRRDPNLIKPYYSHNNKLYHPFINIDKKIIAYLYEYYDLTKSLFPLTRSCESLTIFDRHCGVCWWCEERNWAFNKN